MNKLNKDETKKYIIKIFNFIENGDSKLKGTGYSKIGKVYKLNYSSLTSNNSTYCIQHNKKLRKEKKYYSVSLNILLPREFS